jgi:hypothetical protein
VDDRTPPRPDEPDTPRTSASGPPAASAPGPPAPPGGQPPPPAPPRKAPKTVLPKKLVVFDVAFILIGLGLVFFYLLAERGAVPGGTTTTGRVTAERSEWNCAPRVAVCRPSWYLSVTFPIGGGLYSGLYVGPLDYSVPVGTPQQVSYLPSNPQDARDLSVAPYPQVLGIAIGLALIALGVGSLAAARSAARRGGAPTGGAAVFVRPPARHRATAHPPPLGCRARMPRRARRLQHESVFCRARLRQWD